jgi:hypothetical protein
VAAKSFPIAVNALDLGCATAEDEPSDDDFDDEEEPDEEVDDDDNVDEDDEEFVDESSSSRIVFNATVSLRSRTVDSVTVPRFSTRGDFKVASSTAAVSVPIGLDGDADGEPEDVDTADKSSSCALS